MKTNMYLFSRLSILVMMLYFMPIFLFAQTNQGHDHSIEIIPDQPAKSKVIGQQRVEDGTGIVRAVYRPNFTANTNRPEEMAKQYLEANALPLMLKTGIDDLKHERTIETPGGFKVQFKHKAVGYPVYGSEIKVSINRKNQVVFVTNSYKPIGDLQTDISTSAEEATLTSKAHIGISGSISFEKVETVVYAISRFKSVVAYKVNLVPAEDHFGDWEIIIDAHTGNILRAEDKACSHHPDGDGVRVNGSARVFDPDPVTNAKTIYGAPQFIDNNDADTDSLTAQLKTVTLQDISFDGSMYRLEGPYVAIVDFEAPFTGYYEQESSDFYYTRSNEAFEAVNAYFHLDKSMRYFNETLGFDVMPFQYAGGVQFDPHGLNGENNAHYTSAGQIAFGSHPNKVDSGEDHTWILHELGHGLHDWITNGGLSQVDGLSEGLSDYWAQSYTRSLGVYQPEDVEYDYVGIWGFQPLNNPYVRVTNFDGHYPEAMNGEVHYDGQLWSSSLMSIYDLIGKEATDMNCWEGVSMLGVASNQVDAAFAFSQADNDLYDGEHIEQIYNVFYDRGYFPGPVNPFFTANQTNGEGPREVVFTDQSFTFLNEIISWEWDFNNDGEIDSYDQNPTHTFTDVGAYTISFTVSDGEFTRTHVKKNYITVNGGFFVFETSDNERNHSGTFIRNFLESRGYDVVYSNYYPVSLAGFDAAFLSIGNAGEYTEQGTFLEYTHTIPIQEYLEQGGTLYTDGSPFLPVPAYFGYPNADEFAALFGVAGLIPTLSENPINKLTGLDGSFCEGMIFNASNQQINWYIDKVTPAESATAAFEEEAYGNVSIYNEGEYGQKTFHLAYSLAELVDEDAHSSRYNILIEIMEFFGYPEGDGFVVANFEVDDPDVLPAEEIQFTDLSVSDEGHEVNSWAWDFDEDGIVDSDEQHPIWSYDKGGNYDVMLVVSNGQTMDTLIREDVILVRAGIFVYEIEENGVDLSGAYIRDYLQANGYDVVYANHFPTSLVGFDAVFLSFGSGYYTDQVLNDAMAARIRYYGLQGGYIYLEGAKALGIDQAGINYFWLMLGIENVENGVMNAINHLQGQEVSIMNGMEFNASNQFDVNNIDVYEIDPSDPNVQIAFEESDYGAVAVQYAGEFNQRSFCFSYVLAHLVDEETPNTRDELLKRICNFFDIITTVDSPVREQLALEIYPNPTKSESIISYYLMEGSVVSIDVFDYTGKIVNSLVNKFQTPGNKQVRWNTSTLPAGMYFCRLRNGNDVGTVKVIKME